MPRRFVLAALAAGLVFALAGPAFVHGVLPAAVFEDYLAVFRRIEGPGAAAAGLGAAHVAMVLAMRLAFGFVAVGAYVWLGRHRPFLAGVLRAAAVVYLATYAPLLAVFHWHYRLPGAAATIGAVYGVVEVVVATACGAGVLRRAAAER